MALAAARRTDADIAHMNAALENLLPVTRQWGETTLAAHGEVHQALYTAPHNTVMIRMLNDRLVALVTDRDADAAESLTCSHIAISLTAAALEAHETQRGTHPSA